MELTIDGRKVHYTDSGEGRTLLVLQGWAAPADLYASVAKRLEGKMRVVIPDMPGFGATPEPEEAWGSEDYARALSKIDGTYDGPDGKADYTNWHEQHG